MKTNDNPNFRTKFVTTNNRQTKRAPNLELSSIRVNRALQATWTFMFRLSGLILGWGGIAAKAKSLFHVIANHKRSKAPHGWC